MKKPRPFLLTMALGLLLFSLGCGSSGGSGGSNPYSGNFNVYAINGEIEALAGTMQITQNGTGGSAVWSPIGGTQETATSVTFNGTHMDMSFVDGSVLTGTWSNNNQFNGTTTVVGFSVDVRLNRI